MNDPYPLVEVAVVLITDSRGRFLVDFNDPWGRFTFPITKVGDVPPSAPDGPATKETPAAAATRAAAEVLGRPLDPKMLRPLPCAVPPWNQSGRDGQWKRYTFHPFTLTISDDPKPVPGHVAVWLTRAELQSLEPISPTVRKILERI